jgi:hypothetical protein
MQMVMIAYVSVPTILSLSMPLAVIGALLPLLTSPSPADSPQAAAAAAAAAALPVLAQAAGSGYVPLGMPAATGHLAAPVSGGLWELAAGEGGTTKPLLIIVSTVLIACGAAAGIPCTLSLITEYITVDGVSSGGMRGMNACSGRRGLSCTLTPLPTLHR